jgi:hypothetical protein
MCELNPQLPNVRNWYLKTWNAGYGTKLTLCFSPLNADSWSSYHVEKLTVSCHHIRRILQNPKIRFNVGRKMSLDPVVS